MMTLSRENRAVVASKSKPTSFLSGGLTRTLLLFRFSVHDHNDHRNFLRDFFISLIILLLAL